MKLTGSTGTSFAARCSAFMVAPSPKSRHQAPIIGRGFFTPFLARYCVLTAQNCFCTLDGSGSAGSDAFGVSSGVSAKGGSAIDGGLPARSEGSELGSGKGSGSGVGRCFGTGSERVSMVFATSLKNLFPKSANALIVASLSRPVGRLLIARTAALATFGFSIVL